MANLNNTYTLGAFIELADQASASNGQLVLVMFKSVGAATDTTMRNCQHLSDLTAAGLVECDFTNYARKVMATGGSDFSVSVNTSTFTRTLTFGTFSYNPAGGAVNNSPIKSAVCYRPTSGSADSAYRILGIYDATGSANGGTYSHTPGTLSDDA
ncbi:MAG TPA: hypothetical protein VNH17_15930 [Streptosporangiaceae bacterium]|nr:hypothetical protein [Streptosporangiaceae bacterium]